MTDVVEQAQTILDGGDTAGARELLREPLLSTSTRPNAIGALARSFAMEGRWHIAFYLYQEAMELGYSAPGLDEAVRAVCDEVEASGFTEDFRDMGHRQCPHCTLHFRAEHVACPYCAAAPQSSVEDVADPDDADPDLADWEDSAMDKMDKAGRDILNRARELADSRSVKEMGARAKDLGKEAADKARVLAEKPEVKEVTERAKALGKEAGDSLRKALDSDTGREVQRSAEESGKSLVGHLREFAREERQRYDTADQAGKRAVLIKWGVAAFALLLVLRLLAWML